MRRAGIWLLTIYLGTAPVFWLPVLGHSFKLAKFVLVAAGVAAVWYSALQKNQLRFPRGMPGPVGFIVVLLCSSFAFFQANPGSVLSNLQDLVLGFIVLWTFSMLGRNREEAIRLFRNASFIVLFLCLLVLLSWFTGFPGWRSPGGDAIWEVGFAGLRTGWSNGICFYLPMLVTYPLYCFKKPRSVLIPVLALVTILGTQLVVGGRGGMLGSFAGLLVILLSVTPRKYALLTVSMLAIVGFLVADFAYDHLRLNRLQTAASTGVGLETLDYVSSGRIQGYQIALDLSMERPLTGYGFDVGTEILNNRFYYNLEVHNVWLRLLVDGGILLPLAFLTLIASILRLARKRSESRILEGIRRHGWGGPIVFSRAVFPVTLVAVLVSGLTVSMFEPNVLVGAFQNEALWWAAAGTVVSKVFPHRKREVGEALG